MKNSLKTKTPVLALVFFIILNTNSWSQITQDYLQFSQLDPFGSARIQAMGGAFHALGGGVSSLHLNPAATAVDINSKVDFGLAVGGRQTKSNFTGSQSTSKDKYLDFGHAGGIIVAEQIDEKSPWRKISFGFSMATLKNFDQSVEVSGNTEFGLSNYFSDRAQGTTLSDLQLGSGETLGSAYAYLGNTLGRGAQLGLLAYQAYLIDPENDSNNNINYVVAVNDQRRQKTSRELGGSMRQFNVNIATQYGDDLFFGLNINSHILRYTRSNIISESAVLTGSPLQSLTYRSFERTNGEGFSLQVGAIYTPGDHWRMSLSYDSPTWWQLNEESTESLNSSLLINQGLENYFMDPDVRNYFEPYRLRTPGQWNVGLAYVFGPQGLISGSLSQKNYGAGSFNNDGSDFFQSANSTIENSFDQSISAKLGGEYRYGPWRLRGGYWMETQTLKELGLDDNFGYSYGLGFYGGGWTLDAALVNSSINTATALYQEQNRFTSTLNNQSFILSFGIDL
jgi:long-subunit fatty acid transport protein